MAFLHIGVFMVVLTNLHTSGTVITTNEEKRILLDGEPDLNLGGEITQLRTQLMEQQKLINALRVDLEAQKSAGNTQTHSGGRGFAYTRWGRTMCPPTASVVYKGFTAGKKYSDIGSGTNNMCLPEVPTWSHYVEGHSSFPKAYIYGTELNIDDSEHIFNNPVNDQDIPCVVCWSNKSHSLMIPGNNDCYSDWQIEYNGYLMGPSNGPTHKGYYLLCVDENPEFVQGDASNNDEHLLYLVEAVCGSLPCPPYVSGRELACVVCSK